ncbi:acyl-CoA dehydrogenase family protein [Actinospica durhamensis]|uniref:Acyl-CoA dehydrogenase family protein n=1 Tax=Actinospica durhamensis TaxID=1508375 RepID=A0A941ERR9_9ACTN|nr:acyl-CoA dehydrogenase family protein [Actinospica durhamensis]MBR7835958.1 acyl-CoA dehydrogenase family protein [Actinospica durhamensis]
MQHVADAVDPRALAGHGRHAEALRAWVGALATAEIAPYAARVDASRYFPLEAYDALRAAGLHAPYLPTGFGGAGFGESAVCAVIEELARVCGSAALIPAVNLLGAAPLLLAGDARLKRRYLAPVAAGEALIASAMFEDSGEAEEVGCRAVRAADGRWRLYGAKPRVVNAGVAHFYTVLAVTDPQAGPERGLSVFVLEDGDAGLELGERLPQHGVTGIPTRRLLLHGVELGEDRLVGTVGDGLRIARRTREYGQVAVGAHAVGVAQAALDCAAASTEIAEVAEITVTEVTALAELVASARNAVAEAATALESADPASAAAAARARGRGCAAATRVTREVLAALAQNPAAARATADRLQRDARAVAWPAVAELERQGTDLAA